MDANSATSETIELPAGSTASVRAWSICLLMLLATMLNYMDRQALAQQATEIGQALGFRNEDYGRLESGFGLAFAIGGIVTGLVVDHLNPRWLYPMVLFGWSAVGFATGFVTSYDQLWYCRVLLGFFEAGQWPCALVTAQRLLSRRDRALGNSLIQSGASLGAIATPMAVLALSTGGTDDWRLPFRVIGAVGVIWVAGWLLLVRSRDLSLGDGLAAPDLAEEPVPAIKGSPVEEPDTSTLAIEGLPDPAAFRRRQFVRRLIALAIVVTVINLCFHFFRAWMPKMLREQYGYDQTTVQRFSIAYYLATDAGCLAVGFLVRWLAGRGLAVHTARMTTFAGCCVLTAATVLAASLPASWGLLAILLVIGFGSLGQFPTYYAFTQELSARRMGKVTGLLSFAFWFVYSLVQKPVGLFIDSTGRFSQVMLVAGLLPAIGLLAMLVLWGGSRPKKSTGPRS